MVLQIEDQYHPIDVKMAAYLSNGDGYYSWISAASSKVKMPVYPLIVVPDGDIMEWKIKWKRDNISKKPHCPPGLEDFWSKPSTNV